MLRRLLATTTVLVLAAAAPSAGSPEDPAPAPGPGAGASRDDGAPAPLLRSGSAGAVEDQFIVVMRPHSGRSDRRSASASARGAGGTVLHEYSSALSGFAARLPQRALAAVRRDPQVAYVEADQEARVETTQTAAPWGLDRVDQRSRPLSTTYSYDATGSGVTAYVVDTGIRRTHRDFGGRVLGGFTAIRDGRGTRDCNGHGTHVAGTLGGTVHGVAKQVAIRPVRVLNCRGYGRNSGILAGLDWVSAHHVAGAPAVANVSIGGPVSAALDAAVASGIADGVTYVVAAGNEADDACRHSPGRAGEALTVASTTRTDARSSFSNHGSCVDLFAPGSGIRSAWHSGDRATNTISGTSMAAPHVAGAAAVLLQAAPTAPPSAVASWLLDRATTGHLTGLLGSPDRLLYLGADTVSPPAEPG